MLALVQGREGLTHSPYLGGHELLPTPHPEPRSALQGNSGVLWGLGAKHASLSEAGIFLPDRLPLTSGFTRLS